MIQTVHEMARFPMRLGSSSVLTVCQAGRRSCGSAGMMPGIRSRHSPRTGSRLRASAGQTVHTVSGVSAVDLLGARERVGCRGESKKRDGAPEDHCGPARHRAVSRFVPIRLCTNPNHGSRRVAGFCQQPKTCCGLGTPISEKAIYPTTPDSFYLPNRRREMVNRSDTVSVGLLASIPTGGVCGLTPVVRLEVRRFLSSSLRHESLSSG